MPVPQLVEINETEKPQNIPLAGNGSSVSDVHEVDKSTCDVHLENRPEIEYPVLPYKDQISELEKCPEPESVSSVIGVQVKWATLNSEFIALIRKRWKPMVPVTSPR